jgi:hypothetical protein
VNANENSYVSDFFVISSIHHPKKIKIIPNNKQRKTVYCFKVLKKLKPAKRNRFPMFFRTPVAPYSDLHHTFCSYKVQISRVNNIEK